MKKHLWLLVPIAVVCTGIQSFAAENESPIAALDRLITAGQYAQALDLGDDNLEDWEGDPEFDFLYGLAALESGSPNEAVFALERVAATSTDGILRERARLELARAYFVTNNLTAAENLFNLVLANNPPGNVQQNVDAFLILIETRRASQSSSFTWALSSFVGSDDNVNSATSLGTIDTPIFGDIELDPNGQQIDDVYSNTRGEMNYKYVLTRDRSVDFGLDLIHLNNFDTDAFDIDSLRASATYNWGDNINRFSHGFVATKVLLDQNGFQDSVGLSSAWQHASSNGWYQSVAGSYTQIRYDTSGGQTNSDLRDVDQLLITAGLTKISGAFTHSLNLYRGDEDARHTNGGEHNGREFTGLAYSLLYRLNTQHTPYLRVSLQEVDHDSEHPVFSDTTRNDDIESVTAGWFYQFDRNLLISGEASYTNDASNISLFDHHRFKFQAGFRYRF